MARTNRPDEAYHIPTLNVWFAGAGLVLLITSVWMVWADYNRSWKETQREFRDLSRERLAIARQSAQQEVDAAELESARAEVTRAREALLAKKGEIATLDDRIRHLEQEEYYEAKQAFQFAKAALGDQRYLVEEFGKEHPDAKAEYQERLAAYECEAFRIEGGPKPEGCAELEGGKSLWDVFKDKEEELEDLVAQRKGLIAQRTEAEAKVEATQGEVHKIEKRLEKLESNFFNDVFRDAPLLDFLAPSLTIEQAVIKEIRDDYNFATVQKEDRCMTCHKGIAQKEWATHPDTGRFIDDSTRKAVEGGLVARLEEYIATRLPKGHWSKDEVPAFVNDAEISLNAWLKENTDNEEQAAGFASFGAAAIEEVRTRTQVFRAHPNLDLYTASTSAHPVGEFGCTVCHEGRGHATEFNRVFHMPVNDEKQALWEEKYGWHEPHYWDYPQIPADRLSASCAKCHDKEIKLRDGGEYTFGRRLVERYGCYGCHRLEGITGVVRKAGPSLEKIPSKIDENFAYAWIWNPKNFRPPTRMPRFFEQSNNSHPEALNLGKQEVRAMVAYLFANHDPYDMVELPDIEGDPAHGKTLFREVGCLGCHPMEADGLLINDHGPDLSGIGSKLSPKWMYNWIKDPKRYWALTRMPSFRLTDREAMDLVAYMGSLKKEGWKTPQRVARDAATQRRLLVDAMGTTMRRSELETMLNGMSEGEREVLLGERTIARYGCTGCHDVKGLEEVGPIGTELSLWRDKFVTQLDFALIPYHGENKEVDFNHISWATNKLTNPRFWDRGKVETKKYNELLRMPNFGFDEEQVHALVTFLISRRKQYVDPSRRPVETPEYLAVQGGRRLARDYNCHGCHYFDHEGGQLALYWDLNSAGKAEWVKRDPIEPFVYLDHVPGPVRGYVPPVLLDQGNKTQPDWLFGFLKEPIMLRPLLKMRMPTFGLTDDEGNTITSYFAGLEGVRTGVETSYEPDPQLAVLGQELFKRGQCTKCHLFTNRNPKVIPATVVSPNLKLARQRLQHQWTIKWLRDPQAIMPGANMPNYFDWETNTSALDPTGELIGMGDDNRFEEAMKALNDYIIIAGEDYVEEKTARREAPRREGHRRGGRAGER